MMTMTSERREEKLNYHSTIEIFRDLSQIEIEEIDRQITMSTCPVGNVFYTATG